MKMSFNNQKIGFINDYGLVSSPETRFDQNKNTVTQQVEEIKPRRKTMFTKEEDERLRRAVEEYGDQDWTIISSILGNRTRRQCRERWTKFLNPNINHSEWTEEEDELLLKKYEQHGPKWSIISRSFKNRTDINIKTRYITLSRRQKKEQAILEHYIKRTNNSRLQANNDSTNSEIILTPPEIISNQTEKIDHESNQAAVSIEVNDENLFDSAFSSIIESIESIDWFEQNNDFLFYDYN